MSRSDGFILPLMMILVMILSLLLIKLYQVESLHLSIFSTVQNEKNTAKSLPDLKIRVLSEATRINQNSVDLIANPSNTPKPDTFYLRTTNAKEHIWQYQSEGFQFLIACHEQNSCQIFRLRHIT